MAPKRHDRLSEPPVASTPDSEEESSSAEEEDDEVEKKVPSASSDEEEVDDSEDDDQPVRSHNPPTGKPDTQPSREESDSEDSGSETESDSGTPSPKSIVAKPKEPTPQPVKSRSKPTAPPAKPTVKRAGDADQSQKGSKRPKKEEDGLAVADDDAKKLYFQRKWSEDDEIAVLNGMLEYHEKKGTDPMVDTSGFHDFIKKSLHFDVSKAQLVDKLRRLKKKYVNRQGKGRNGEDPSFSKAHEQKSFDLSKMIWSENGVAMDSEATPKANGKARKAPQKAVKHQEVALPLNVKKEMKPEAVNMEEDVIKSRDLSLCSNADQVDRMEKKIMRQSGDLLSGAKKEELDKKWRKLQVIELELYLERQALVSEHARVLLEHYKSSDK